jgi:hypothetical protein
MNAYSFCPQCVCVLPFCSDDDNAQRLEQDGFGPGSYPHRVGHCHWLLDHLAVSGMAEPLWDTRTPLGHCN